MGRTLVARLLIMAPPPPPPVIPFRKRNPLLVRSIALLFAIIVYGVMSIEAWKWKYEDRAGPRSKRCRLGDGEGVCTFGILVSFFAFLAAIAFLAGEFLIERPSFITHRLNYFLTDLIFSGTWTLLFLICFFILEASTSSSAPSAPDEPPADDVNVGAAVCFSLLSVPAWGASTYMALQRWRVVKAEAEYASDVTAFPSV